MILFFSYCLVVNPKTLLKTIFDPYDVQVGPYDTNIQWTDYGIPHITGSRLWIS